MDLVREFGRQLLEAVACVWIILWPILIPSFRLNNQIVWLLGLYLTVKGPDSCALSSSLSVFFLFNIVVVLLSYTADMHDLRLIHTDLKPENILLVSSEYVKVPGSKVFCLL